LTGLCARNGLFDQIFNRSENREPVKSGSGIGSVRYSVNSCKRNIHRKSMAGVVERFATGMPPFFILLHKYQCHRRNHSSHVLIQSCQCIPEHVQKSQKPCGCACTSSYPKVFMTSKVREDECLGASKRKKCIQHAGAIHNSFCDSNNGRERSAPDQ
jgi:hypothetical protein